MAAITVTQFRCALYARVSAKDKGQEFENQLRQLREFAGQNGGLINADCIDHESGRISDREQSEIAEELKSNTATTRRTYAAEC